MLLTLFAGSNVVGLSTDTKETDELGEQNGKTTSISFNLHNQI